MGSPPAALDGHMLYTTLACCQPSHLPGMGQRSKHCACEGALLQGHTETESESEAHICVLGQASILSTVFLEVQHLKEGHEAVHKGPEEFQSIRAERWEACLVATPSYVWMGMPGRWHRSRSPCRRPGRRRARPWCPRPQSPPSAGPRTSSRPDRQAARRKFR